MLWIAGPGRVVSNSAQPWRTSSSWGSSSCPHLYLICQRHPILLPQNVQHKHTELPNVSRHWTMPIISPWIQQRAGQSAGGRLTSKNVLVRVTSMTSSQQGAVRRLWSNSSLQHLNGGARVAAWLESVSHRFDWFQCQHGKSHGKTN